MSDEWREQAACKGMPVRWWYSLKYATATVQRTERTGGSSAKPKPAATQEEPF